jgi:primosomal protein N' (replication factor Y)
MKVARVCIDSPLPHLDREFEYAVPDELLERVRVGCRVKVPFGHRRQLDAWVIGGADQASFDGALQPVRKVVGTLPVLDPDVWTLVRAVADRQAGIAADVLRLAIPPRHARAERAWCTAHPDVVAELLAAGESAGETPTDTTDTASTDGAPTDTAPVAGTSTDQMPAPEGATQTSASGPRPGRGTMTSHSAAPRPGWPIPRQHRQPHVGCDLISNNRVIGAWATDLVALVADALERDETTIVAVPDFRDVAQAAAVLAERFPGETVARLDAGLDDEPRYRSYLDARGGIARIIVGTRTAVYAPARHLGQIIVVEDGDPSYREPHAPYAHTRDVALVRQRQTDCRLVFLSNAPSVAVERLIEIGYVQPGPPVPHPRVIPASAVWGDDPLLQLARIPQIAYAIARDALRTGPVLVQVARAGYQREVVTEEGTRTLAGAGRTADELGRAFREVPVIVATADQVREQVGPAPALVVATAGAEPRCPSGYRAVLLLDALAIVSREGLTAAEDAIRHWFTAAALARPDGTVVLTGVQGRLADALVQWDARPFAREELAQRAALGFPPAVRFFSITTDRGGTQRALADARLPETVEVVSTELLPAEPGEGGPRMEEVTLLRVPYAVGEATARALKAAVVRATTGPARAQRRLRVHADDVRMLTTA